jgi:hypothetical protein
VKGDARLGGGRIIRFAAGKPGPNGISFMTRISGHSAFSSAKPSNRHYRLEDFFHFDESALEHFISIHPKLQRKQA